jgi:hypothetical protein
MISVLNNFNDIILIEMGTLIHKITEIKQFYMFIKCARHWFADRINNRGLFPMESLICSLKMKVI